MDTSTPGSRRAFGNLTAWLPPDQKIFARALVLMAKSIYDLYVEFFMPSGAFRTHLSGARTSAPTRKSAEKIANARLTTTPAMAGTTTRVAPWGLRASAATPVPHVSNASNCSQSCPHSEQTKIPHREQVPLASS